MKKSSKGIEISQEITNSKEISNDLNNKMLSTLNDFANQFIANNGIEVKNNTKEEGEK